LLRAIDDYTGYPITKYALLIAPHVFVRPDELRHVEWKEIDFDAGVWKIPEGKMKARRAHAVPLSRRVIAYLSELEAMLGSDGYVFPSARSSTRPMSENTLNAAFRRMGFSKEEVTAHGLRATASTMLNESGLWSADAIERGLAHGDSNAIRGIYHRGKHWDERVRMAQWWSDHLDELRSGGRERTLAMGDPPAFGHQAAPQSIGHHTNIRRRSSFLADVTLEFQPYNRGHGQSNGKGPCVAIVGKGHAKLRPYCKRRGAFARPLSSNSLPKSAQKTARICCLLGRFSPILRDSGGKLECIALAAFCQQSFSGCSRRR
jgi:hypothetical protein